MPFLYFLIFYVSARSALHLLSNHKGIFCIRNRNICIFLLWNLFLLNNVILNNFLCCFIKKETINPTSLTVIFSGIISNMHFLSNSTFKCNCSSAMTSTPALQNLIFAEVFGIIKNLCPLQLNILSCVSLFVFSIQRRPLELYKSSAWNFEWVLPYVFWKITTLKISGNFPINCSWWVSF